MSTLLSIGFTFASFNNKTNLSTPIENPIAGTLIFPSSLTKLSYLPPPHTTDALPRLESLYTI